MCCRKASCLFSGREGQIIAGRAAAAFGGAKWRVTEDDVDFWQLHARAAKRIAEVDHALVVAFHAV